MPPSTVPQIARKLVADIRALNVLTNDLGAGAAQSWSAGRLRSSLTYSAGDAGDEFGAVGGVGLRRPR